MASKSSPARPAASRGPVITLTTTRAFTFPNYSKAAQLPAGEALRSKAFDFHGRSWRVKLYPTGFTPATRDFVAVFVKCRTQPFDFYDAVVTVKILDKKGEGTVFDDATAKTTALAIGDSGFSKGYVEFARRREVAAACVRDDDSIIVRCTLLIDAEVVAKPPLVLPWRRTAKADDGGGMVVPTPSWMKSFALDSATDTDAASTSTATGVPEVVTGSHTLTISQFSEKKALLACGECLRSAQFRLGGSNWYIKVYPNGHDAGSKDNVSFFLARGRSGEPETTAEFAFELANFKEAGGNNKSAKVRATFDNSNANSSEHLGFQRAAAELQSAPQMRSDRLIVRCKLGVFRGKPPCPLLAEAPAIATPPDTRSSDFLWLLKSQEGSDVTYAVGGTTFRAHSCILSARSPVFREEMRELVDNPEKYPWRYINVEEEEMTAQAFEALLHVVYTDQLPGMSYVDPTEETVEAMLFAAERYGAERLKLRCEQWLCSFVTPLTVADILSMAVRYDLRLLEDACVKYATPDHVWEHVKGTEGFNRLRASCPHIVREIEGKQRKY
nr:BTB/POZ and MATH domain-containing protein 1-like [Setaria viridis]